MFFRKKDIILWLQNNRGFSKNDAEQCVNSTFDAIKNILVKDISMSKSTNQDVNCQIGIVGFGTFTAKLRSSTINVPDSIRLVFKPSETLKKLINSVEAGEMNE